MAEEIKNDWIKARAIYNEYKDITPFYENGYTADNTIVRPYEEYINDPSIVSNPLFKDGAGRFDQVKFKKFYDTEVYSFNKLQNRDFSYNYENDVKYSPFATIAPTADQIADISKYNPSFRFEPNPFLQQKGFFGFDNTEDSMYSMRELAQGNTSWDGVLGEWIQSPDDLGFFGAAFGDTYVLATWDSDGYHVDEMTGAMVPHKKGDPRYGGARQTFFYEKANGQSLEGKQVLNPFSVITVDGSDFDKYNFLDNDDRQKSIVGSTAYALFNACLYLNPWFGTEYALLQTTASAFDILQRFLHMFVDIADNNSLFGNAVDLSGVSSWFNSVNGVFRRFDAEVSDYSQEEMFTYENVAHLTLDVIGQVSEMRSIMEYSLGGFKNPVKAWKTELAAYNENQAKFLAKKESELLPKLRAWALEDQSILAGRTAEELNLIAKHQANKYVQHLIEKNRKIGEQLAKYWMTGEVCKNTYHEARAEGASAEEALLITMAHVLFERWVMNFGISERVLPELKAEGETMYRVIAERALGIANEQGDRLAEATMETGIKAWWRKLVDGIVYNKGPYSRGLIGGFAGAAGESLEEVTEEFGLDVIKSVDALFGDGLGLYDSAYDNQFTFDTDFFNKYIMNALGGAIGGFANSAKASFRQAKFNRDMTEEQAWNQFVEVVRNGKADELRREVDKMRLGSKTLSNLEVKGITGENYFLPSNGSKILSQDEENHMRIYDAIKFIESALGSKGIQSDTQMTKDIINADVRYMNLMQSTSMRHFFNGYNDLVSKIVERDAKIKTASDELSGLDESKILLKQQEIQKLRDEQAADIEKLHNEFDIPSTGMLSQSASKHLELAMWEMTNMSRTLGLDFSLTSIAEVLAKKKWKDMGDFERNKYLSQAIKLKKEHGFEYIEQSHKVAKSLLSQYCEDGSELYSGFHHNFDESNYMASVLNDTISLMSKAAAYITGDNHTQLLSSDTLSDIRTLLETEGATDPKKADAVNKLLQKIGIKVNGEWGYYDEAGNFVKANTVWNEELDNIKSAFDLLEESLSANAAIQDESKRKSTKDVFADAKVYPTLTPFVVEKDGEEVLDVDMMKAYKNMEMLTKLFEDIKGQGLPMVSFANAVNTLIKSIEDAKKAAPKSEKELNRLLKRLNRLHAGPKRLTKKILNQICRKIDGRLSMSQKDVIDMLMNIQGSILNGNLLEPYDENEILNIQTVRDAIHDMRAIVQLCARTGPSTTHYNNTSFSEWLNTKNASTFNPDPTLLVMDYNDMLAVQAYLKNLEDTMSRMLLEVANIGDNRLLEDMMAACNFKRCMEIEMINVLKKLKTLVPDDKKEKVDLLESDMNDIKSHTIPFNEMTLLTEDRYEKYHARWIKFEQDLNESGLLEEFKKMFSESTDLFNHNNVLCSNSSSVVMTEKDNLYVHPDQVMNFVFSRFMLSPKDFYEKCKANRQDPTYGDLLFLKSQEETIYQASAYAVRPDISQITASCYNALVENIYLNTNLLNTGSGMTLFEFSDKISAIVADSSLYPTDKQTQIDDLLNDYKSKIKCPSDDVSRTYKLIADIYADTTISDPNDAASMIMNILNKKSAYKRPLGFVVEGGPGSGKSTAAIKFALSFLGGSNKALSYHVSTANAEKNAKYLGITDSHCVDKETLFNEMLDGYKPLPVNSEGIIETDTPEEYMRFNDNDDLVLVGTHKDALNDFDVVILDEYTSLSETEIFTIFDHTLKKSSDPANPRIDIPIFLCGDMNQNSITGYMEADYTNALCSTRTAPTFTNRGTISNVNTLTQFGVMVYQFGLGRRQLNHAPRMTFGMRAQNFHKTVNNINLSRVTDDVLLNEPVERRKHHISNQFPEVDDKTKGSKNKSKSSVELFSAENKGGFWGDRVMFNSERKPGTTIREDVFDIADKMIKQLDQSDPDPTKHEKIVLCDSKTTKALSNAFRARYGAKFDTYFTVSNIDSSQGNENAYYISYFSSTVTDIWSTYKRVNTSLSRAKKGSILLFEDDLIKDKIGTNVYEYKISQFFYNGRVGNKFISSSIGENTKKKHQNTSNKRIDKLISVCDTVLGITPTATSSAPGPYVPNPIPVSLLAGNGYMFGLSEENDTVDTQFSAQPNNGSSHTNPLQWGIVDFSYFSTYTTHKDAVFDLNKINTQLGILKANNYDADSDIFGFYNKFGITQSVADLYNQVRTLVLLKRFDDAKALLGASGIRFEYRTTRRSDNQIISGDKDFTNNDNIGSSGLYAVFENASYNGVSLPQIDVIISSIPDLQNIIGRVIIANNHGNQQAINDTNSLMSMSMRRGRGSNTVTQIRQRISDLMQQYNAPTDVVDIVESLMEHYYGTSAGLGYNRESSVTILDPSIVANWFNNQNPVIVPFSRMKDADTDFDYNVLRGKTISEYKAQNPSIVVSDVFISKTNVSSNIRSGTPYAIVSYNQNYTPSQLSSFAQTGRIPADCSIIHVNPERIDSSSYIKDIFSRPDEASMDSAIAEYPASAPFSMLKKLLLVGFNNPAKQSEVLKALRTFKTFDFKNWSTLTTHFNYDPNLNKITLNRDFPALSTEDNMLIKDYLLGKNIQNFDKIHNPASFFKRIFELKNANSVTPEFKSLLEFHQIPMNYKIDNSGRYVRTNPAYTVNGATIQGLSFRDNITTPFIDIDWGYIIQQNANNKTIGRYPNSPAPATGTSSAGTSGSSSSSGSAPKPINNTSYINNDIKKLVTAFAPQQSGKTVLYVSSDRNEHVYMNIGGIHVEFIRPSGTSTFECKTFKGSSLLSSNPILNAICSTLSSKRSFERISDDTYIALKDKAIREQATNYSFDYYNYKVVTSSESKFDNIASVVIDGVSDSVINGTSFDPISTLQYNSGVVDVTSTCINVISNNATRSAVVDRKNKKYWDALKSIGNKAISVATRTFGLTYKIDFNDTTGNSRYDFPDHVVYLNKDHMTDSNVRNGSSFYYLAHESLHACLTYITREFDRINSGGVSSSWLLDPANSKYKSIAENINKLYEKFKSIDASSVTDSGLKSIIDNSKTSLDEFVVSLTSKKFMDYISSNVDLKADVTNFISIMNVTFGTISGKFENVYKYVLEFLLNNPNIDGFKQTMAYYYSVTPPTPSTSTGTPSGTPSASSPQINITNAIKSNDDLNALRAGIMSLPPALRNSSKSKNASLKSILDWLTNDANKSAPYNNFITFVNGLVSSLSQDDIDTLSASYCNMIQKAKSRNKNVCDNIFKQGGCK